MKNAAKFFQIAFIISIGWAPSILAAPGFMGLGDLPGGSFFSRSYAISNDGSTVVGESQTGITAPYANHTYEAFRWTEQQGMVSLGPGSRARGVSADGNVVAGAIAAPAAPGYAYGAEAFVWTEATGIVSLGDFPGGNVESNAQEVSDDGTTLVGWGHRDSGFEAFRWTQSEGLVGLGDLPGGAFESEAASASSDGSVVVGQSADANGLQAFRWTSALGMVDLGDLPGASDYSVAYNVSADGDIVVGQSRSANHREAFVWTESTGMVGLGDFPGGSFKSVAKDVSDDGSVIVGRGYDATGFVAAIWDEQNGMRAVKDVLEDSGIDLTGWSLWDTVEVSGDGNAITGLGYNPSGQEEAWIAWLDDTVPNEPPVADAGTDQAIRAGDTVFLDGSASFDDNTASSALLYSWSFSSLPAGSTAAIIDADTATPSFVADIADTYGVELVVIDEGGLASESDEVLVSADNLAPTAAAGNDQLVLVGTTVNIDGSASSDPEFDSLTYAWTISAAPAGSSSMLVGANSVVASFVPDLEGIYQLNLMVSDSIGPGEPDAVQITAATAEDFSELQIVASSEIVAALSPGQVTTGGNQNALLNFLSQAVTAIQEGDLAKAIDKVEKALGRTDGCVLRGSPDGNGQGRDWITDCTAQIEVYGLLTSALAALAPE